MPDGANNGIKALKLLKVLYRVCAAHDLQSSASHATGNDSRVRTVKFAGLFVNRMVHCIPFRCVAFLSIAPHSISFALYCIALL